MDKSASEIGFNEKGVCNFCDQAQKSLAEIEKEKPNLQKKINQIKYAGANKKYDILIGLSGGIDSSMALYQLVALGLRALCFSIDNGWQDDKAQENIMRLVEGLKVPFYRYTIDLKKFKELQAAFMKAGQINIEIPTDHLLMAASYEMAAQYGIKWIVSGGNVVTESIMPESWGYQPRDLVHIKSVYKWTMGKRLKGLPVCGLAKWNWYHWVKGIRTFYILDYLNYNRAETIKMLEEKFGYKPYGEKHEESVFTKWFQNFYLFEKFGIDKRKAHFSSLINSGQMTRKEAMELLQKNPEYPELGIEERIMKYPKRSYKEFKTDEKLWKFLGTSIRVLRKPYRRLMSIGAGIVD